MKLFDKITPSIYRNIWGKLERAASDLIPNPADIVMLYRQSFVGAGGEFYKDVRPGVGAYDAGPGVSLAIAPGETITFAGMDSGVTVTSHDGTATVSLTSSTLSCSIAGSLYHLTLSDGSTYTCAQGAGGLIINDQAGIDGVLVGFTFPGAWVEDIEFGHVWENYSEYELADGQISGVHTVEGKVPQSPTIPTQDIFGNALTNPGTGRNDMPVTGVTGNWDGVAVANFTDSVALSGDFRVVLHTGSLVGDVEIVWGGANSDLIRWDGTIWRARIGGVNLTFSAVTTKSATTTFSRVGTQATITDGVLSQSQTCTLNAVVFKTINRTAAGRPLVGVLKALEIYNASDTLIHEWIVESRKDSLQPIIYDRIGGNHATLINATLGVGGFWSAEKEGSLLLEGGFYDDGTSLIPADPNTGLSVLGQLLTQLPGKFLGGATDGVEIVVNGNLTDGTTSWLPNDSAVLSVDAGRLKVTNGANLASDGYQIIPTIIGRTYIISLILENGNNPARLMVGTGINNFSLLYKAAGYPIPTLVTDTFTATTTTTYVSITTTTPSTGQYCFASSISVQEYIGEPFLVYAPETKAFYDLAVLCGIGASLYLDGVAIGLTPDEWAALTPTGNLANAIFRSITKDTFLVGYNPALTGTDITKAEKYLGI